MAMLSIRNVVLQIHISQVGSEWLLELFISVYPTTIEMKECYIFTCVVRL